MPSIHKHLSSQSKIDNPDIFVLEFKFLILNLIGIILYKFRCRLKMKIIIFADFR